MKQFVIVTALSLAALLAEADGLRSQPAQQSSAADLPLITAAKKGDIAKVEQLLSHGTKLNSKDEDGYTALNWAAENGHLAVVTILIEHGAPVDSSTKQHFTPLMNAAAFGHLDVVSYLIAHGAKVNALDTYAHTTLMWAANSGYTDVVTYILDHGAAINLQDKSGYTALSHAEGELKTETAKVLRDHGGTIGNPDKYLYQLELGRSYARASRCTDALPHLQTASSLKPDNAEPWAELTDCYAKLQQWNDTLSAGAHAQQLKSDDTRVTNDLGVADIGLKRYSEAVTQLEAAARQLPKDAVVQENLGDAYLDAANRDGAMRQYTVLKALDQAKADELMAAINAAAAQNAPTQPSPPDNAGGPDGIPGDLVKFTNGSSYVATVLLDGRQICVLDRGEACSSRLWDHDPSSNAQTKHPVHINIGTSTYDDPAGGINVEDCHWNWLGIRTYEILDSRVHFDCIPPKSE